MRALGRDTEPRNPLTLAWQTRLLLRLLLLTGCRVGETLKTQRQHVDLDAGTWQIPGLNTKTLRPHVVFLSDAAKTIFAEARTYSGGRKFVFESDVREGEPVRRHSINRALNRLQAKPKGKPPATKLAKVVTEHFTVHDLTKVFRVERGRVRGAARRRILSQSQASRGGRKLQQVFVGGRIREASAASASQ
jgi:integrase